MYKAVIVDNRPSEKLDSIIDDHMKMLPGWECDHISDVKINSAQDYNNYVTSESFLDRYQEFERILIFQHDSGLLREGIEEFLEYDYVGAPWFENAPWARKDRRGGNGGLSLRSPKKMLNLIKTKPYNPRYGNEDVYFVHNLELVNGAVAPYEVCRKFSIETEFNLGSMGYHAIAKHLTPEQVDKVLNQYER